MNIRKLSKVKLQDIKDKYNNPEIEDLTEKEYNEFIRAVDILERVRQIKVEDAVEQVIKHIKTKRELFRS